MHWILAVTVMTTGASTLMGSYKSEEECQTALKALFEMRDHKKPLSAGCIREDNKILKIFQR